MQLEMWTVLKFFSVPCSRLSPISWWNHWIITWQSFINMGKEHPHPHPPSVLSDWLPSIQNKAVLSYCALIHPFINSFILKFQVRSSNKIIRSSWWKHPDSDGWQKENFWRWQYLGTAIYIILGSPRQLWSELEYSFTFYSLNIAFFFIIIPSERTSFCRQTLKEVWLLTI